jgi:hypothetical protein
VYNIKKLKCGQGPKGCRAIEKNCLEVNVGSSGMEYVRLEGLLYIRDNAGNIHKNKGRFS